ncbi:MAG TPA: hypothetical protein VEI96_07275, partial [Thermodesulfovibrionales bacterium]|nr:hypothetical protein [Thermodesulfovibrionales bacterium]
MALVFLIYGLAFFILGFAIVVYPKKQSNFALARSVWLIAAFGILHGLNEWVDMFIIIERPSGLSFLYTMRSFLLPASFIALLQFGIGGIVTGKKRSRHLLRTLPAVLLILWSSAVFKSSDHVLAADVWARYLLCVPGTALTSLVLMRQSAEIADLGLSRPKTYLMLSALGFLFYGFLSGLIVPDAGFFPASLLNYTMFEKTAGLKVQIFRTACALVVTFNMIKVLEIFELEAV